MSRHNHHSSEVTRIVNEISHMTQQDIVDTYGIFVDKNGRVEDPTYSRKFETVAEWAQFSLEQEEMEYSEQFHHGKMTHDDYY